MWFPATGLKEQPPPHTRFTLNMTLDGRLLLRTQVKHCVGQESIHDPLNPATPSYKNVRHEVPVSSNLKFLRRRCLSRRSLIFIKSLTMNNSGGPNSALCYGVKEFEGKFPLSRRGFGFFMRCICFWAGCIKDFLIKNSLLHGRGRAIKSS